MSAPTRTRPASTEEYVARLVAEAPPPTDSQIVTVRGVLGPALAEVKAPPAAARARRARSTPNTERRRAAA